MWCRSLPQEGAVLWGLRLESDPDERIGGFNTKVCGCDATLCQITFDTRYFFAADELQRCAVLDLCMD